MKTYTTHLPTLLIFISVACFVLSAHAQTHFSKDEDESSSKLFTIEAHYGFPNLFGQFVADQNDVISDSPGFSPTSVEKSFINPCGFRIQYRLSPILNVGASFVYSKSRIQHNDGPAFIAIEFQRFRGFLRSELVYNGRANRNYELYGALCLGITQWHTQTDTNIPFVLNTAETLAPTPPIAGRLVPIGFRYFFNDYLGFNTELGFGQALLSAGVSGRF